MTVFEPLELKDNQSRLARLQRQLARKVNLSANWKKQKNFPLTFAYRQHPPRLPTQSHNNSQQKPRDDRYWRFEGFQHVEIGSGYGRRAGRNVAAKSGLNRAILDQGWYEMRRQLEYKQRWRGGEVLAVNLHIPARNRALRLSVKENRQSQAVFVRGVWLRSERHKRRSNISRGRTCRVVGLTTNAP